MTIAPGQRPYRRPGSHRDGERVLPGPKTAAQRLCPDGHLRPTRWGFCPRCGTRIAVARD